jgi:hypothetical protein
MKKLISILIILISSGWFSGCSNLERSMIFSTHTTVGLEIAVSPQETQPVNIIIGYKRSEGVLNPVYDKEGLKAGTKDAEGKPVIANNKYRDKAYSVIAKLSGKLSAEAQKAAGAEMSGAQWFATGIAADNISGQPGIAGAITGSAKIAEAAAKEVRLGALLPKESKMIAWRYLDLVYTSLESLKDHDPVAGGHLNALNTLAKKYPSKSDFVLYSLTRDGQILFVKESKETDVGGAGTFGQLIIYQGKLKSSVSAISYALKKTGIQFQADDQDKPIIINKGTKELLQAEMERQQTLDKSYQEKVGSEKTVIEAAKYLSDRLISKT